MEQYRQLLDVEAGELPLPHVMVVRTKASSSKSNIWRLCGVFLAVALCAAAAVCFMLQKSQSSQEDGSGLRLTLRDHLSHANFTSKAAIHLTGSFNIKVSNKTLDWKEDQDQAFASGGLELVNGEIIIPTDGVYFVYSQVSFHISCTPKVAENHDLMLMSHAVWRFSDSYGSDRPLLSAIRSACAHAQHSDNLWYNTIYLGAAFRLIAGDRLHTDTTAKLLDYVDSEHGKTFFGAFAL